MPKRPSSPHALVATNGEEEAEQASAVTQDEEEQKKKKKKKRIRKRQRREKIDDPKEEEPSSREENDVVEEENKEDEVSRTIYMEGIPFAATREQVLAFLTQPLDDSLTVLDLRLPQWQDTGRLRGYGHAVLASTAQCQAAIQHLHRRPFSADQGRYITVAAAVAPKSIVPTFNTSQQTSPPTKTLVLRNVPYDATEETLQEAFGSWREDASLELPIDVRVVRHYAPPHRSKGLAYVEFATIQAAQAWMERPHPPLQGRSLLWDYDQGRMKASFRDAARRHYTPASQTGVSR